MFNKKLGKAAGLYTPPPIIFGWNDTPWLHDNNKSRDLPKTQRLHPPNHEGGLFNEPVFFCRGCFVGLFEGFSKKCLQAAPPKQL